MKFHFSSVNLWCNKNLVDAEHMLWLVLSKYWQKWFDINFYQNPLDEEVEYILLNTCGFLSTAREEAEHIMRYYDDLWKKIILTWCYVQVADSEFLSTLKNLYRIIPFLDYNSFLELIWFPAFNVKKIENLKDQKLNKYLKEVDEKQKWNQAFSWKSDDIRAYLNAPLWYEYLKIAEWCDNSCTFCIIPRIRWKQKSKTIEDIEIEAKALIDAWVRDIILIAQDTTAYWTDIYWLPKLVDLLERLNEIEWDFTLRCLYMYPDNLNEEILKRLSRLNRFIPYFDIPFQHISEPILKRMWRYYDNNWIENILSSIRSNFKSPFIRTSFIIWFPWESDIDFNLLYDFVKSNEFDWVSLFEYHDEKLAASSKLDKKVDQKTSFSRINKLSKLLNEIAIRKKLSDKWKRLKMLDEIISWFVVRFSLQKLII